MWQHIPYYWELITLIVSSIIILIIIHRTSSNKKFWRIRSFIAAGSLIWFISKLLELGFIELEIKLFWYKTQILGLFFFTTALLIFSIYYSGRHEWYNKAGKLLLLIIPSISIVLLYLDNLQSLVIDNIRLSSFNSILVLDKVYNNWYWVIVSYILFLNLISVILLNAFNRRTGNRYQWRPLISILVLAIFPSIIVLYSLFGYQLYPYLDIIPFVLASGCLVISGTIYRVKGDEIPNIDNCSVIDSFKDSVILLDNRGKVLYMNRTFKNSFSDQLNGTTGKHIDVIFPILSTKLKAFETSTKFHKESKTFFLNGNTYELSISGLFNQLKRHVGKTVIIRDITEKRASENIIRESEEKYRMIFEKSSDGIFRYNLRENNIETNPALVRMLGYNNGKRIDYKHIKEVLDMFREEMLNSQQENGLLQKQVEKIDGSKIWVEISPNKDAIINGDTIYNGIIRDITIKKSLENKIRRLSFHDKLTGLYNRAFFEAEIKRLDKVRQLPLTVVISDVDGLKVINDAFGHETGDKLIKKVAGILKVCFRSEDIVSRYGGDEFAILLPSTSTDEALKIIKRVKSACKKESNKMIPLSISIGVATKEEMTQDMNSIIKDADDLMYRNKLVNKKSPHSSLIFSLEKALEERNYETVEHVRRIKEGVVSLGKDLDLEESSINDLKLLSTLHDIGKIGISDNIILKSSKLSNEERKAVEKHSEIGYRIAQTSNELSKVAKSILHHHEWWNGEGYPHRLKGKKIPINSRIVSIVDAYDAMTNDRPYRRALSKDKAISELIRCSDSQFDPSLTKRFLNIC